MKTRKVRAVLDCSRGTPKAYRALGKSSVAARESPIGEYALPPPEILIGEYSSREILIGDRYWGLLGTIGECPEISGAPKSLLGNTVCGWQNVG